ncbi:MAG: hypothetical protein DSM106950_15525 [Stigonema ocellatum SAG 48.90 = DSM 106950]|nr:hypothetical protein [Stigonema ocellatum SAG 48.90 = DSM 106950]
MGSREWGIVNGCLVRQTTINHQQLTNSFPIPHSPSLFPYSPLPTPHSPSS